MTGAFGGVVLPPVLDKLIVWLKGDNVSSTVKRDSINSYNFLQQNCPPDYLRDNNGDLELDMSGNPIWITYLYYQDWECEYLAPAIGQPGHEEIVAVDITDLFYDPNGIPIPNNKNDLYAVSKYQFFFCELPGKGLLIYNESLTGAELAEVQAWMGACVVTRDGWETDDGEPWYTSQGEIYTEET
jgi:hypothetical protein